MASTSVQFRSAQEVIQAYTNRDVAPWSIFHDKQFQFKYEGDNVSEGAELLQKTLTALQRSAAIYTLKVYEDLSGKIKSNTPDDGSFNFRFSEYASAPVSNDMNEVLTELRTLRLKVEQMEGDDNDEPENKLGLIGDLLAVPGIAEAFAAVIPALIGKVMGTGINGQTPTALAGIPGEVKTIEDALQLLQEKDPRIKEHLIKLAIMARDQPGKFSNLIKMMAFL